MFNVIQKQIIFLKNLEKACKSGLPVGRFFHTLADNVKEAGQKNIYRQISKDIEKGLAIANSLKKHPQILDSHTLSLINVGEKSGKLAEVTESLVQGKTRFLQIKKQIYSELRKPCFEMLGAVLIFVITIFVINASLSNFYNDFRESLPSLLVFFNDFQQAILSVNSAVLLIMLMSAVVGFDYRESGLKDFREYINCRILTIPIIGNIIKNYNLSFYFLTLKTCYVAGLSTIESVQLADATVQQPYLKGITTTIYEESKSGEPINSLLAKHEEIFDPALIQLIEIGEETGRLDESYNDAFLLMQETIDSNIAKLCLFTAITSKLLVLSAVLFVFANVGSVIMNSLSKMQLQGL